MTTITQNTTIKELIELGAIDKGMISVWNSRLDRQSRSSRRQNDFDEVKAFIKENAAEGVAYKTGNFLEDVLKEKSSIGDHLTGDEKRKYVHTMITLSLKSLVDDDVFVVFNTTNNHAHNRYGLKPNLDEVPEFSTNVVNENTDSKED